MKTLVLRTSYSRTSYSCTLSLLPYFLLSYSHTLTVVTPDLPLIGSRLKEYLQLRGLTISGVARMSKFSQQEIDNVIEGGTYPLDRLMQLLDIFEDLNPEWVLHGHGTMLLRGLPRPPKEDRDAAEARDALRRYAAMPPNPEIRDQVAELQEQVAELKAMVQDLTTRLALLESHPPRP